jgi:hypothetical protein
MWRTIRLNQLTTFGLCGLLLFSTLTYSETATVRPPVKLTASKNLINSIKLTWQANKGTIDFYTVFRADSVSGAKKMLASTTVPTFTDLSPKPNKNYSYTIKACLGKQCSAFSSISNGQAKAKALGVPANFTASNQIEALIHLEWDIVLKTTNYQILRDGKVYATTENNTFSDTKIKNGQTYQYAVKACDPFAICSKNSKIGLGLALAPASPVDPVKKDDDDILDMIVPVLTAIKKPEPTITFTTAPISQRCAISWDDSHQPTGIIHYTDQCITKVTNPFTNKDECILSGKVPHPEWKRLHHCYNVETKGPTGINTADAATKVIIDGIKSEMNSCINNVMNEGKTLRLLGLVSAIAVDLYSLCVTGCAATIGVVSEYTTHVVNGSVSCVEKIPEFSESVVKDFANSFSVKVNKESEWIYWDM